MISRDRIEGAGGALRPGLEFFRHHGIERQQYLAARRLRRRHDLARRVCQVRLAQRLADIDALRMQERVGHAAADHQRVEFGHQIVSREILVETLAPPTTAATGRSGCRGRSARR